MVYEKTKHLRHSRQENRSNCVVNVNPNTVAKSALKNVIPNDRLITFVWSKQRNEIVVNILLLHVVIYN